MHLGIDGVPMKSSSFDPFPLVRRDFALEVAASKTASAVAPQPADLARLPGGLPEPGGLPQAFTSYNNPKGNTDTERMMRTLKEEFIWLHEWKSPAAFIEKLDAWVEQYNNGYLHSRLAYSTPMQHEREYQTCHSTQLAAS